MDETNGVSEASDLSGLAAREASVSAPAESNVVELKPKIVPPAPVDRGTPVHVPQHFADGLVVCIDQRGEVCLAFGQRFAAYSDGSIEVNKPTTSVVVRMTLATAKQMSEVLAQETAKGEALQAKAIQDYIKAEQAKQ